MELIKSNTFHSFFSFPSPIILFSPFFLFFQINMIRKLNMNSYVPSDCKNNFLWLFLQGPNYAVERWPKYIIQPGNNKGSLSKPPAYIRLLFEAKFNDDPYLCPCPYLNPGSKKNPTSHPNKLKFSLIFFKEKLK